MSYYSLKDLRSNLSERIQGLGINPKFLENPAYSNATLGMGGLISQMNLDNEDSIIVSEEDGVISFKCATSWGVSYSMSISSPTPDSFRAVEVIESKPYRSTEGDLVRSKDIIEIAAALDEKTGMMTITTNSSMLQSDSRCKVGTCYNAPWARKCEYNNMGVMTTLESKYYNGGELSEPIETARIDSALYIPRQVFNFNSIFYNNYSNRTLLRRQYLDVARIVIEDKNRGFEYSAFTPLKAEHGLRDMVLVGGYEPYPEQVTISPLTSDSIDYLIQLDADPKVQEGLRAYAKGRENYYYDSSEDRHFVYRDASATAQATEKIGKAK